MPTLPVPFLCPARSAKPADSDIWAETAWLVLWKQGHPERPEVGVTIFHLPPPTLEQRLLTGKGSGGNGLGPQSSSPHQRDPEKPSFCTGETTAWEERGEPRYKACENHSWSILRDRLVCANSLVVLFQVPRPGM